MVAVGVIIFIAWLVFMVFTVVAFVVWAWKENQLKDIEEPKYRMLEEIEPEPWPGREPAAGAGSQNHKTCQKG